MLVGVDIGGTKIAVSAAEDPDGRLVSARTSTPATGEEGLREIVRLVQQCVDGAGIEAVGLACAGPLDIARGMLVRPRREGWADLPVVGLVASELGAPVVMDNDANCGGVAEHRSGAGRDSSVLLYVTISTGIGTGLVVDGKVFRGAHDTEGGCITLDPDGPECPACGGRGHFESFASGLSLKRDFGTTPDLIFDPAAWDEIGRRLAVGLSSLMAMMSPDRVVLAGGVANQFDRFREPLERHLASLRTPYGPAPVVPASYVDDAPVRGALHLAREAAARG